MFNKTLVSLFGRTSKSMSDRELKRWAENEYRNDYVFAYNLLKAGKFKELQETYRK